MFKVSSLSPNIPALEYTADASVSYTNGDLLYRDTSTGEVKAATSATVTTVNIEAICQSTETTAASSPTIRAIPIISGMLVEADCDSDTAANQLNKAHLINDTGATVINTDTQVSTSAAVFIALKIIGATTDKKLLGYFVKVGQVAA